MYYLTVCQVKMQGGLGWFVSSGFYKAEKVSASWVLIGSPGRNPFLDFLRLLVD